MVANKPVAYIKKCVLQSFMTLSRKKNANPWENILILDVICLKFAFSKYVFCLKLLSKKV